MANILFEFITNRVFLLCFLSWFIAQAIKFIIEWKKNRKLDQRLFTGITSGGMPSSHTSLTTTFTTLVYMEHGMSSIFLLAVLVTILTIHYVLLLNKHTAEHAKFLNRLSGRRRGQLEQRVGHKPFEVFAGFCLGLVIALFLG